MWTEGVRLRTIRFHMAEGFESNRVRFAAKRVRAGLAGLIPVLTNWPNVRLTFL